MCSNYVAVSTQERLLHFFGVFRDDPKLPPEIWPTGLAPFIRLAKPGSGNKRVVEHGHYGMLPSFAKEVAYGRRTYNARGETVGELPSYREAWRQGWRCIIPAEILFEPFYPPEGGRPVRWAITKPGRVPMGVAGIYRHWRAPDGSRAFSFAMLTVNADSHPFYSRFHKPGEEKRMPVILDESEYDAWLMCDTAMAPSFFQLYEGALDGEPAPLPPRAPPANSARGARPAPPPEQSGLF